MKAGAIPEPGTALAERVKTPLDAMELAEMAGQLTVRQEIAAEIIADGGRMRAAAKGAEVDEVTLWRWASDPQYERFQEYCIQLRSAHRADRQAKRERVMRKAFDILAQVLDGELGANDERAIAAAHILDATEWRIYGDDSGPAEEQPPRRRTIYAGPNR